MLLSSRLLYVVALLAICSLCDRAFALTIGANPADALDPRDEQFGAKPNDGEDDREALQKWIDEGCKTAAKLLYLPPGDWHVSRRPQQGTGHIGSLKTSCDGLTILGAGRSSRLLMLGRGVLPQNPYGAPEWRLIEIDKSDVTIEGIALDGSQRADTGEQTHLVQLLGPARNVELRRLYLNLPVLPPPPGSVACRPKEGDADFDTRVCIVPGHPDKLCKDLGDSPRCTLVNGVYTLLGWFQGGDCIRSLGSVAEPVDGVTVADSQAAECDRSFIGFQRNSYNFTVTGNATRKVMDQIIDQEPTGTGGMGKIVIMGNRFERGGAAAQGAVAISLTGNGPGAEIGDSMLVSGNVIDGGVHVLNVSRVSIEHNVINGNPFAKNAEPVIKVLKHTDSVRLIGNDIDRPAGSVPGNVIQLGATGSGRPADVTIALNTIRQYTDGSLISMEGAQHVSIVDNALHCNQTSGSAFAIKAQGGSIKIEEVATPVPVTGLVVSRNRARGRCAGLVRLSPNGSPVGAVTVTGNQTRGFAAGVQFTSATQISVKPRISDNLFEETPPAEFVKPPGLAFNGENGPQ